MKSFENNQTNNQRQEALRGFAEFVKKPETESDENRLMVQAKRAADYLANLISDSQRAEALSHLQDIQRGI